MWYNISKEFASDPKGLGLFCVQNMSANPGLPREAGGQIIQLTPSRAALARTVDATISASTEITLNTSTRIIRVYAISQDVYLKWGTDDVTASNFDEVIPAGQIVDLVIPAETVSTLYTAINLIERTATAGVIVIEK